MIVDRLQHYKSYPFGKAWQLAFDFIMSLDHDVEAKKYPLQGDDIFAIVMDYETRYPENAVLESHRKYMDIQSVITGEEGMGWCQVDELQIDTPYDSCRDAQFYKQPEQGLLRLSLYPGNFVALFPHDAHIASLMTQQLPVLTKKVVVKVNVNLL